MITMELHIQKEKNATTYTTVQLHTPLSSGKKAVKNDIMTTAYHGIVKTYFIDITAPTQNVKILPNHV